MNRPLRIGLIDSGGAYWSGGVEYLRNLALALANDEFGARTELYLILRKRGDERFFESMPSHVKRVCLEDYAPPEQTIVGRVLDRMKPPASRRPRYRFERYLVEELCLDFVYPLLSFELTTNRLRWACWIPDFQYRYLPEHFKESELQSRAEAHEDMASKAPVVVFSSESVLNDFVKFYPGHKTELRVMRFRSAPDEAWYATDPREAQAKFNLPDRFFVICNQLWRHKNHLMTLETLARLKERGVRPTVVWTGPVTDYRNPSFIDELLQAIQALGLHDQIHVLGRVSKLDQIQLIRRSLAVIQPSQFEGWSTVVEEARCFGKTMYLSNIPPNVEQDPPHAHYFDSQDADELAAMMEKGWAELEPGPHADREEAGREENRRNLKVFGRTLYEIAAGT